MEKADSSDIRKVLNNFPVRFIQTDDENMEEMWTDLNSSIQEVIEKRVPTKITLARDSHLWMNGHEM